MKKEGSGWKGESRRHSLARKGIKTVIDDKHRLAVNNYVARGISLPEVDISRKYWGMKINADGTMKLSLGNMTDYGWYWNGDETELGGFLTRIADSKVKDEFLEEMKKAGITFEMLKPTLLEHIDDKEGNGMYSLTGDNTRWHRGESYDMDLDYELFDEDGYYRREYNLSQEDLEEIRDEFYSTPNDSTNIDAFEKSDTYANIFKLYKEEIEFNETFENFFKSMNKLEEQVMYEMVEWDQENDMNALSTAFDNWTQKKAKEGRIIKAKASGQLKKQPQATSLIREWNDGKMPKTKAEWEKLLKDTNHELATGYWANKPNYVDELREIKYHAQKKLKKIDEMSARGWMGHQTTVRRRNIETGKWDR